MAQKAKANPFDKGYNLQPGMDKTQMKQDMSAWRVSFEETICKMMNLGDLGGPQVGNNYSGDAMGEERMHITYAVKSGKGKTGETV